MDNPGINREPEAAVRGRPAEVCIDPSERQPEAAELTAIERLLGDDLVEFLCSLD